ncbi:MAG: hypothetical protein ACRC2T_12305 [Thermoguttaceae bacterium]
MKTFITATLLFASYCGLMLAEEAANKPRVIKFTISPETTYFTEPLFQNGNVDYIAALNKYYSEGITNDTNIVPALFSILPGEIEYPLLRKLAEDENSHPEDSSSTTNTYRKNFWAVLGMTPPPLEKLVSIFPPGAFVQRGVDPHKELLKFYSQDEIDAKLKENNYEKQEWRYRNLIDNERNTAMRKLWTEKELPLLAAWIKTTDELTDKLKEITRRPHYFMPMAVTNNENDDPVTAAILLPYVQSIRELARFMSVRGGWDFTQGEYDKAFECAFSTVRIGKKMTDNPGTIVEYLVGLACIGIAQSDIVRYLTNLDFKNDKDINAAWVLNKKREYDATMSGFGTILPQRFSVAERCMGIDTVKRLLRADVKLIDELYGEINDNGNEPTFNETQKAYLALRKKSFDPEYEYDCDKVLRLVNEAFDECEDSWSIPNYKQRLRANERLEKRIRADGLSVLESDKNSNRSREEMLVLFYKSVILPAFSATTLATIRTEYTNRLVDITFMLTAYRAEHGEYPDSLDALVPHLTKNLPVSPYTDKPIKYVKRDGYVVLSGEASHVIDGSDAIVEEAIKKQLENNESFVYPEGYTRPLLILKEK